MSKPYWNIRLLIWLYEKTLKTPVHLLSAPEARRQSDKTTGLVPWILDRSNIQLHKVSNKEISGRHGKIPVRIYRPSAQQYLPIILYFHGGGFVIRTIDTHDKVCRRLCRDNQAVVISVGYRLAPEYKFPMGLEDCYDSLCWATDHAEDLGVDKSKLVVMGDSAGGNLATAVAMMARDLNGPSILYQVLIYPTTDGFLKQPSIEKYKSGYLLTKNMMEWFVNHYKKTDEDLKHPYLSMLYADNLKELPPALIITAEFDPLIDEGFAYAQRLKEAGVAVSYTEYPRMVHAFFNMAGVTKSALRAFAEVKEMLEKVFEKE